jgi:hypothetical protein
MSSTDRQNRLLVAQDWKRIYQTFANADFQSYDFENLRRVMIQYIRENYPEDFNDYIESSEYLALIDVIAFLGQSIAFRADLNARDNFLELAERRESVLRFAKLLSYPVSRNIPASGLLKFSSVQTTQSILDSNGRNLANQVIGWNDSANSSWYDQFIKVVNAAIPASRQFGNPDASAVIDSIPTDQYRLQAANTGVPVYEFSKAVDGRNMAFEIVSTILDTDNLIIKEEPPLIGNRLAFIHRNDGRGNGSANTGFFLHFRQGTLSQGTFTVAQPASNEVVDLDAINVNNSDTWLYRLDQNGLESEYWSQVSNTKGNNIIYNSLNKSIRNIYAVTTRSNDRISLAFSDGVFGNLPLGTFRIYYRTSNGISYTINPADIRNVTIQIPYASNLGQIETLTIGLNLVASVSNSSSTETNTNIKSNAPANYYTQNRMITAEDYNIAPLSVNQDIVKIKAINRSSSGISRYFDLVDPTGKYSKTNLFADDGALYRQEYTDTFRFNYLTQTDIEAVIYNRVIGALQSKQLRDYYYSKFRKTVPTTPDPKVWTNISSDTNQSIGNFSVSGINVSVGTSSVTGDLSYIVANSLLQFTAPIVNSQQYYFDLNNQNELTLTSGTGTTTTLWAQVVTVNGNGIPSISITVPVLLNTIVPTGAVLSGIIPTWNANLTTNTISTMIDLIYSNKSFGLRYDSQNSVWKIVFEVNLNIKDKFSLTNAGNNSSQQLDSSWLLLFTTDTEFYTVKSRLVRYIFESDKQIRFYFDATQKIYDITTNTVVKDNIKVLGINTQPNSVLPFTYDLKWEITDSYKGIDGYVDTKKIEVTFSDTNDDGIVDDPILFEELVAPSTADTTKYVVLEKYTIDTGKEDYRLFDNSNYTVKIYSTQSGYTGSVGQYFYFIDSNTVQQLISASTLVITQDYKVFPGRRDIKFQYIHNANYEARIDPGKTNIIDIYVLTTQYDINYRQWLQGSLSSEPLPPSTDYLYNVLAPNLNLIKPISDEIVYHPVKYKILFGSSATTDVQATFKVIKNTQLVISDNDVKTRVLAAINQFFALDNFDFGDSFYFSELLTYVMNALTPNIVNFLIVPKEGDLTFGSLFEIPCENDQIFINGASINDIEIISAVTASQLQSAGSISALSSNLNSQNITSGNY